MVKVGVKSGWEWSHIQAWRARRHSNAESPPRRVLLATDTFLELQDNRHHRDPLYPTKSPQRSRILVLDISHRSPQPQTMATSSHPQFPSRPYTSNLNRTGGNTFGATPYQSQTPFNAPPSTQQQQNPAGYGAAGPSTQQQREAQRLERERHERAERERREAEERGVLEALSEEQREEVNEAVSRRTSKQDLVSRS